MELTVNGINWKIKFVDSLDHNLLNNHGIYTFGVTDNNVKTVFLSDKISGELLYKVLCHELCHVYCFSYGIYITIQEEERMAQFISEYGKSIISDTDYLLRLLFHKDIAS